MCVCLCVYRTSQKDFVSTMFLYIIQNTTLSQ